MRATGGGEILTKNLFYVHIVSPPCQFFLFLHSASTMRGFFSCLCPSYSSSREILRVGWEVKKPGFLCVRLLIVRGDCVKSSPPSYFLPPLPYPPFPSFPKIKLSGLHATITTSGNVGKKPDKKNFESEKFYFLKKAKYRLK